MKHLTEAQKKTAAEISKFVEQLRISTNAYIKEKYNTEIPKYNVKLSFAPKRVRSWGGIRGGAPWMSLALYSRYVRFSMAKAGLKYRFKEYLFIEKDPIIGDVESDSWKEPIRALFMHEAAHGIARQTGNLISAAALQVDRKTVFSGKEVKGHGKEWRVIYRDLKMNCM